MSLKLPAAALVVLLPATAGAATLATHTLVVGDGQAASCVFSNLSSKPIEVRMRIFDIFADVVDEDTRIVNPGRSDNLNETATITAPWRCQFDFKGPKMKVRAGMVVRNGIVMTASDAAR